MKPYKAKIFKSGNSLQLIVPAWIKKAFDVEAGDEVVVKLEKVTTDNLQHSDL